MNRPWPVDANFLQIGDVCVDLRYRRVLRDGESVELQQRIFDLMLLFIAEPHKLHTRVELFSRLWPGLVVDDANLSQNVWLLRKALGESRKQWLRTIAKRGYVFEPPSGVTWSHDQPNAEPSASLGQGPRPLPVIDAESAVPSPRGSHAQRFGRNRRWGRWAAGAALLAVVALGLIVWRSGSDRPTPEKPLAVALIPVQDAADTMRWPARLLQDWLGWKLGSLPEVNVLSEADLATDTSQSPVAVFLASARASGADGQVVVRARLQGLGKEQRMEETGPLAQVPAMVDRLSQRIIERLDSPRTKPWPPLDIAAPAAQRYVQAVEAADRRDWMAVSAIGDEVVRQAPRFGLMRLRLAQAQSRLVQVTAAKEQMEIARSLLRPIPDDVKALLDAQALAVDPDHAEQAAKALSSIAARYPAKPEYTLEHARLLVEASQPKEALSLLQANLMQHNPVGLRIARHLVTASAAGAMGDPDLQRLHARAAENLARVAGHGWELERAEALVAMGRADQAQYPDRRDTRLFVEAAKQFDRAGNATGALHAQFLAETAASPVSGPNPRLDTLLAQARAGGYRKLEIDILRDRALQYERAGDMVGYRDWLRQAWAVAQDSGDIGARNQLDVALATGELFDLRLSDVDARLARLKRADPQGIIGRQTYVLVSFMEQMRGNIPAALDALTRSAGKLPAWSPGQPVPEAVARLACDSIELRLLAGDLAGARKDLGLCHEAKAPKRIQSKTAFVEWAAGNRAEAERAIAQARALPFPLGGTQSWGARLDLAERMTLLGQVAESEHLMEEVKAKLPAQGFGIWRLEVAMLQAQNALALGEWAEGKGHAEEMRRLLPRDAWILSVQLDTVDAVLALSAGDRTRAIALASAVHKQARERGQVLVELQMHSLIPPGVMTDDCSAAQRQALMARTGMRGVSLDWLLVSLPHDKKPGSGIHTQSTANTDTSPPHDSDRR